MSLLYPPGSLTQTRSGTSPYVTVTALCQASVYPEILLSFCVLHF